MKLHALLPRFFFTLLFGCAIFFGGGIASAQQGHTLMAQYTFDNGDNSSDSSGNNNYISDGSSWGNSGQVQLSSDAIAGNGSVLFDGGESLSTFPTEQTFDNWLATFYGSFSVSLWVKTSTVVGNDSDSLNCCSGATIIDAYSGGFNDSIPIALTGHKVAFFTGDGSGNNGDTLHSTNNVVTGSYVHIVVTRDQSSGEKKIYVNGVFDSSDKGTTNYLNGDTGYFSIGGSLSSSYTGLLDDVQFYTGVLSAADVAYLYANPGTPAPNVAGPSSGLVAHFDFDEGTSQAADLSGHGNNLLYGGSFGPAIISTNSISGSGAIYFDGGNFLTPSTNLLSVLASNFSLSLWVKTTQNPGFEGAPAYYGAGLVSADVPTTTNDIIPAALTGGQIGFNTGSSNSDDTVNSATDINDGNYHHVVVTRNQATGLKQIYIDGVFSTNQTSGAGLLNAPKLITIGALADDGNPDPASPQFTGGGGFIGLLDDIQIYSRVLTAAEISALHAHPGANATNGLVCHYDFDEGTILAPDVSGHGNNIIYAGSFGGPAPATTSTAISGSGAVSFAGNNYLVPEGSLLSTLSTNFSISVWLQTTQSLGSNGESIYKGAGIITADVTNQNDVVPLALTGAELSFGTGIGSGENVLTSTASINNGTYHHVVVTRNQASGQKQIYIDGVANNSSSDTAAILNSPQILVLGAQADATDSNPNSPSFDGFNGYIGLMDDLQVYSRVISPSEVAYLYHNPGAVLQVSSGLALGAALGATNLTWTNSGDAAWFTENSVTYSTNNSAAESGSILENQTSVLQTTVTGPGVVSFYWQTVADNDNFDLEFDIDGNYQDDIYAQTSWTQDTFNVGSGTHTLTWTASSYGSSSPSDAGFLDQVTFGQPPVITLNPFNQTNYPGYQVALEAAATGFPVPSWQWYKVGNPNPIAGATNPLFIPADSGASSVAGSYYAVASNPAGSQTTSTATVAFVSAALPPDWSEAFKSPFINSDANGVYVANDNYYACLVDPTGASIYSTGYSSGTNYFGTNEILAAGASVAAVIVKQTAAKAGVWVLSVTNMGSGASYGEAIAAAPGGGVYVAIGYSGTNWLGSLLLPDSGSGSILVVRVDPAGNLLWHQIISATNGAFPILDCLVSDPAGNVTFAGVFNSSATVGGTNIAITNQTGLVAQFNSSGALNWAERMPNIVDSMQYGGGRIYISLLNWLSGNPNYTVGGLSNNVSRNYTLAALNATNGQGIWLQPVGEAFGQNPPTVIDDVPELSVAGSNIFLVGTAYGSSAVFGSNTVNIPNGRGQYFARYDTNGNAQLAVGFGSSTTQPEAAVADAAGNVYVAGAFDTYSRFGNDLLAAPRLSTIGNGYYGQGFLAMFDRNGAPQWAREAVSTNVMPQNTDAVFFWDVALAPNGVWVCGEGNGSVYFGANLVNSDGQYTAVGQNVAFTSFYSGMLGMVTLTTSPAPVTLLNPVLVGTNFQFSFISTLGHTNFVQYSTNLAQTNWNSYTNLVGDGNLKTIQVPVSRPSPEFFRVDTQ